MKVGIIGSAGRKQEGAKMTKELFESMMSKAQEVIETTWKLKPEDVILVSGGAAWADHVAVRLFDSWKPAGLHLHLPCEFKQHQFEDNGKRSWQGNAGKSANFYHHVFSKKLGASSLDELDDAMKCPNVTSKVYPGFFARNNVIADESDYLLAFSWTDLKSKENEEGGGGTAYTWKRHKKPHKVNVVLSSLIELSEEPPLKKQKTK